MLYNELTLMPESTRKVLAIANAEAKVGARLVTKVNGKNLRQACLVLPDHICFENRSMFGNGECFSYSDLINLGIKSQVVRCNQDRDLVALRVG